MTTLTLCPASFGRRFDPVLIGLLNLRGAGCEDMTACATLKICALDRKHGSRYASVVH
jgi:hypothetical protein